MSIGQRLSRLSPALTAQERVILILESWKDGRQEEPSWRNSMPREQTQAFNYYIELMNRANLVLGKVAGVLRVQAGMLRLRKAWVVDVSLWQDHVDEIRRAVRLAVNEPITQSEYDANVEAARNEWVPFYIRAAKSATRWTPPSFLLRSSRLERTRGASKRVSSSGRTTGDLSASPMSTV